MGIRFYLAALGDLDAEFGQPKPIGKWFATRRYQHHVGVQLMIAVVFAPSIADLGFGLQSFDALHGSAHNKVHALLF